jgi:hypothetical protein
VSGHNSLFLYTGYDFFVCLSFHVLTIPSKLAIMFCCFFVISCSNYTFYVGHHVLLFHCCSRLVRSQSCPFCRDSLNRVDTDDLWIYISSREVVDLSSISRENLKRLFMYIDKLPLIVPDPTFVSYDARR